MRSVHIVTATAAPPSRRSRWVRRAWTTGAVTLSAFCSLATFVLSQDSGTAPTWNYALGFVLNLVAAVALIRRHEHPWAVLAAALVGPLFFSTDATAALIALFALLKAEQGRRVVAAVAAVYVACVVSLVYDAHRTRDNSVLSMERKPEPGAPKPVWDMDWWIPWLVAAVLVGIVVALAVVKRTRTQLDVAERRRDEATEQTRAMHDEVIRTEERTRIARDMHDTLAAGLSRISLLAGSIQVSGVDEPEKIVNTASKIRATAHESLDELKNIVGVLRGTADSPGGHQGIDAVADLVQSARAAGLHVTLFTDLQPGDVGTASGHVAYRVVQEALTNAQKYAADQTVQVGVTGSEHDGIRIDVRNALSSAPPMVASGSQTGLTGLAEQAGQLGGTVHAGVTADGFVVSCWLPWFA
ncbi:two-component sensor histidine kinase [Rhodococcus rhodnii]|uniref:histidine kinase n=1 Tax=Rhodococcus rhodnii TaxID=38312 RepID=A0A6P2CMZ6_9NOCA|nr:two-component sensor histidine kinase [Rhodococcus rhodnii]